MYIYIYIYTHTHTHKHEKLLETIFSFYSIANFVGYSMPKPSL